MCPIADSSCVTSWLSVCTIFCGCKAIIYIDTETRVKWLFGVGSVAVLTDRTDTLSLFMNRPIMKKRPRSISCSGQTD